GRIARLVQHALPGAARPGKRTAVRLLCRRLRSCQYDCNDRRRAGALGLTRLAQFAAAANDDCYWLVHRMRAIQSISAVAKVCSACSLSSEARSIDFAVLRLSSFAITSPDVVRTTTRSPRRIGAAGDTIMMSPSR